MDLQTKTESERAWADLAVQCTAFVVPEGPLPEPARSVASATILRTPGGHTFLLTARHVAVDVRLGQIWFGYRDCFNAIKTGIAGALLHPNADVDVAILVLKTKDQRLLESLARSSTDVSEDITVKNDDYLVISGYPWELQHVDRPLPQQGFGCLVYNCILDSPWQDELGRMRLGWGKFEEKLGMPLPPAPPGMSGGALWRRRDDQCLIWTPSGATRLIAVQSAWEPHSKTAIVEPSSRWLEWYSELVEEIDAGGYSSEEAG